MGGRVSPAYCLAKFPWEVFLGKRSITAKTVEGMVLPTSLCHRPCFSKVWVTQRQNIHACVERKGGLQLTFQRMCKESSTSHSEGGFSKSYIDVMPNLDMLMKFHDRRPKAFQAVLEFATDGEPFLKAVHRKRKQPTTSNLDEIWLPAAQGEEACACYASWRKEDLANWQHFWRTDEEKYLIC